MAHASNAAAAAAATTYQPAGAAPAQAQAAAPKDPKKDTGGRKVRFSVGHDYKVESVIGEGAYGIVVSARHKHGTRVAIKKVSQDIQRVKSKGLTNLLMADLAVRARLVCAQDASRTQAAQILYRKGCVGEREFARSFWTESTADVSVPPCLQLITVLDIVKPSSFESFKEVYLVQELLETDLHRVIRTQDLSDDHCQYFVYQTCRAIKALHSANSESGEYAKEALRDG